MKCLIIAAGQGSRLSMRGDSKPLTPLLGLSLIERVILTAEKSGITDFYVVTGYNGEKVSTFLNKFSQSRNISITYIVNERWGEGNGLSVLKAKDIIKENFILLMCDHIFDESILSELKDEKIEDDGVILAVDYNLRSKEVDVQDATKVLVKNGRILNIGKNIEEYNAYDTGIFLCSPAIFEAIEKSLYKNDSLLSGGIKILAEKKKVKAFDIKGRFWIDVDDEKALKKAEKKLLASLKKVSDGPISIYLNRPLSNRITRYLVKTNIKPNHISLFSFMLSALGALFFFFGGYINLLIGGFLAQISSIVDGCDGEVARLKFQTTEFGGWFDAVLDRYADAFLLFGLTYFVYFMDKGFLSLFIGFLAIIGAFVNSYTADKYDGLMKKKLKPGKHYLRMGRDIRMFIIFILAILNLPFLAILLIAFLMNVENIRRVLVLSNILNPSPIP